jgi:hypothetical protein
MNERVKWGMDLMVLGLIATLHVIALVNSEGFVNPTATRLLFIAPLIIILYIGLNSSLFTGVLARNSLYCTAMIIAEAILLRDNVNEVIMFSITSLIAIVVLSSIVYLIKSPSKEALRKAHTTEKVKNEAPSTWRSRYLKVLGYGLFAYMIIETIFVIGMLIIRRDPIRGFSDLEMIYIMLGGCFKIIGIVSAFYVARFRKWALWCLTVLFSLGIILKIATIIMYPYSARPASLIMTVTVLVLVICGFSHLKQKKESRT